MASNKNEVIDQETGEVLESKQVTVSERATSGVMIGGQKFVVKQRVNLPTLKHEDGETIAIRIDAPIIETVQEKTVEGKGGATMVVENTINVVRLTELGSGEPFEYVCNAMTADNFRSCYPEHSYVGKTFAITKHGLAPGKQYKTTSIIEIEAA